MNSTKVATVAAGTVGTLLKQWRSTRRMSQLDLSLAAEVSSRHVSYVESGKAQPSREMMMRFADALEIPLRERNVILIAAGLAPVFRETELDSPPMMQAKRAIEFILKQQEPYPAIVLDRHWNLVDANAGARHLLQFLIGGLPAERNIVRHIFSHQLLRPYILNWEATAGDLIHRLHQEVAWVPTDEFLRELLQEALSFPGVPQPWRTRNLDAPLSPLLTFNLRKGETELRFLSTWTTFGTAQDVTLEELRIESSFPADVETAQRWHQLIATMQ